MYDQAEVTFQGGPFDGTVVKRGPDRNQPTGPPAEAFAGVLCFIWGAERNQGTSIVGKTFLTPLIVDGEFRDFAYNYRVEAADVDDGTLRIRCGMAGTTAALAK